MIVWRKDSSSPARVPASRFGDRAARSFPRGAVLPHPRLPLIGRGGGEGLLDADTIAALDAMARINRRIRRAPLHLRRLT